MDARLLFPKEYIAAPDLQGKDVTLTIAELVREELRTDKGEEEKWTLHFAEMRARHAAQPKKAINKRLVLNKTNAKTIMKLYGTETNDWLGRRITLYATTCQAFGETVDCIRIRERIPAAADTKARATQRAPGRSGPPPSPAAEPGPAAEPYDGPPEDWQPTPREEEF